MKNYASTIRLHAAGDQTRMEWTASFDPEPGQDEIAGVLEGIFQAGIDNLTQRLGRLSTTSPAARMLAANT